MAQPLKLRRLAVKDLGNAYDWYEQQSPGLGEEFLLSAEDAFQSLFINPHGYAEHYPHVRKCNLRRFPYSVYYRIFKSTIAVLAVYHQSRNPQTWQKRKK